MRDPKKWELALAGFLGYSQRLPSFPKAEDVQDYHRHIAAMEEASDQDLSAFKIPDDKLKPRLISARRGGYGGGPGSVQYSKEKECDSDFFEGRVEGLKHYLATLSPLSRPRSKYDDMSDSDLQSLMQDLNIKPPAAFEHGQRVYRMPSRELIIAALTKHENRPLRATTTTNYNFNRSNFVQNSPNATVTVNDNRGFKKEELLVLMDQVRAALESDPVGASTRSQISLDVDTINLHLNTDHPNTSIIKASLLSLKAMIENAGGALLAPALLGLLPAVAAIIDKLSR